MTDTDRTLGVNLEVLKRTLLFLLLVTDQNEGAVLTQSLQELGLELFGELSREVGNIENMRAVLRAVIDIDGADHVLSLL